MDYVSLKQGIIAKVINGKDWQTFFTMQLYSFKNVKWFVNFCYEQKEAKIFFPKTWYKAIKHMILAGYMKHQLTELTLLCFVLQCLQN